MFGYSVNEAKENQLVQILENHLKQDLKYLDFDLIVFAHHLLEHFEVLKVLLKLAKGDFMFISSLDFKEELDF